jgi:hypothetical protein
MFVKFANQISTCNRFAIKKKKNLPDQFCFWTTRQSPVEVCQEAIERKVEDHLWKTIWHQPERKNKTISKYVKASSSDFVYKRAVNVMWFWTRKRTLAKGKSYIIKLCNPESSLILKETIFHFIWFDLSIEQILWKIKTLQ